jgi:hypothetical protein
MIQGLNLGLASHNSGPPIMSGWLPKIQPSNRPEQSVVHFRSDMVIEVGRKKRFKKQHIRFHESPSSSGTLSSSELSPSSSGHCDSPAFPRRLSVPPAPLPDELVPHSPLRRHKGTSTRAPVSGDLPLIDEADTPVPIGENMIRKLDFNSGNDSLNNNENEDNSENNDNEDNNDSLIEESLQLIRHSYTPKVAQ